MPNPYRVLEIHEASDDEAIRRAYAEAVRRVPPERDPEAFRRVQDAYEKIGDRRARLRFRLFEPARGDSFDEWIEEIRCETRKKRLTLEEIRRMLRLA